MFINHIGLGICDETIHVFSNSAFGMQRNPITRDGGHLHRSGIQNFINKSLGQAFISALDASDGIAVD